jgi:hypothetical protein
MKNKKILVAALLIPAVGLLVFVVARSGSFLRRQPAPQIANPTFLQGRSRASQPEARARNLSMQPEAFKMGRRLGARFDPGKRDISVTLGTLTIGSERHNVQTKRVQTDDGEQVEIKIAGSGDTLTWDAGQGILSSGRKAGSGDRDLIERLVFDSPDQFVLAQLRGASYYTVARNVRPAEAADPYQGPLWDVVRVDDPERDEQKKLQSAWRLYYLNARTGLIDKIESEVAGQRIVAEVTGWTDQNGEAVPVQIVWKAANQTLMTYSLGNFSHVAN